MAEIKRRAKKNPLPDEKPAPPPRARGVRVTLTKDVSSRYRKMVPRAKGGASPPPRPPRFKDSPPERGAAPKPAGRREGGAEGGLRALISKKLPEAARQIRETQDLLRTSAEEILTLLETWTRENLAGSESEHPEETKGLRILFTSLFEKMSFQDLAGQRLAKVENFLKALAETTRPAARPKPFPRAAPSEALGKKPFPARRGPGARPGSTKKPLKGPQTTGRGLNQKEVEALMADLGPDKNDRTL